MPRPKVKKSKKNKVKKLNSACERRKPLSAAEKQRLYRLRKKEAQKNDTSLNQVGEDDDRQTRKLPPWKSSNSRKKTSVKAGGMRITQHKTPHTKDAKEGHNEDLTGLSGPSPVPSNPVSIVGAPNKGNEAYTPEAAQVAHSPKPPVHINVKPSAHIQQPRK